QTRRRRSARTASRLRTGSSPPWRRVCCLECIPPSLREKTAGLEWDWWKSITFRNKAGAAVSRAPIRSTRELNSPANEPSLARRLGLFDATMIVMGGIIGAGIFVNPSVVSRQVHTPMLILGAWLVGG